MVSFRLAAFFIIIACLLQSTRTNAQALPSISISVKDAPLEEVLKEIQGKTGYAYFIADITAFQTASRVTLTVNDRPLPEVLELLFKDQPVTYQLIGHTIKIKQREDHRVQIRGLVLNDRNEPVAGASITPQGAKPGLSTMTDEHGEFRLLVADPDQPIVVTCVNYEPRTLVPGRNIPFIIHLKEKISQLSDVIVSNGYQTISKDRTTGSFNKIDNELINRRVSTGILDRLDGVTSSLIFNKNIAQGSNQSQITIRGRSTIFASPDPLVIIDNFPYSGDINNINPDDVESITILKDAAAASIWGAFSGNGVIVITTRKGKYNQAPKLSFNTSLTGGLKPNLHYLPILGSSDYIDVEQFLFGNQYYLSQELDPSHPALSPAVEIMIKQRDKLISPTEAQNQLDALRHHDTRDDLRKYFYQPSWNQKYALSLTGGGPRNEYFLSAGFDKNADNLVRNGYDRITINGNNTYSFLQKKLEFTTAFALTSSRTINDNTGGFPTPWPYVPLVDAGGKALAVPYQLRLGYVDTVGNGSLLDWHYRPLDELSYANNKTNVTDYRISLNVRYMLLKGLDIIANYQFAHGNTDMQNNQSILTYAARNLINEYSQPLALGGYQYPIPMGGILDELTNTYNANNFRTQANFNRKFGADHEVSAIAGFELRDIEGDIKTTRLYGYDGNHLSGQPVNYSTSYPQFSSPGTSLPIPYYDHNTETSDRFLSYFFNGSYIFKDRYTLSGSARRDESNLFGVNANQKGVPLWSIGGAWEIAKEGFYGLDWLPYLKLRLTNGYNGNVDRSVSAYTTATTNPQTNFYGQTTAVIINPPNPALRWEKIHILNTAIDFGTRDKKIEGSLEYYKKTGLDLIGNSVVDPTTGFTQFTGNTANMVAHGIDLILNVKHKFGKVRWNSNFLFSYVRDKVTAYSAKLGTITDYFNPALLNPLPGHPLYSVYALRWMGLDPQTGDPQGYLNGLITKNYSAITNSGNFSDLLYKGPANPPFFGSWRNSFSWRQFTMSFNIVYKFGSYFTRPSINYNSLFGESSQGNADYLRRWKHPGDERSTFVPSMTYPANGDRDFFYANSEVLIQRGDFIRLQDIQFNYDLKPRKGHKLPADLIRFYLYANNMGILWKANRFGIDPDNIASIPNPRTLAVGVKFDF